MKKVGLIVSIILLTGVITFTLLRHRSSTDVQLVKFKGVENVTNLTKGHLEWLSAIDYAEQINAIPAQENDLIYGLSSENNDGFFVLQHKKQSDKVLNVRFDSLGAYMDERLATLMVQDNEPAVFQWLSQCTKDDLQHLQSVFISDSLTQNNFQELRKIGKYTSGIGLIIDTQSRNLDELQQALKPSWLWLSNVTVSDSEVASLKKMDHLESLILSDAGIQALRFSDLKKLKMLHLDSPDSLSPAQLNAFPKELVALQISNADIRNLDFLDSLSRLKELTVNHCSLLQDISSLEKLPHLTALSLAHCDSLADLTPLNALKKLKWFAPPKNISEQQLASILNTSPDLQSLVLVDCQHIKSLNLLGDSHRLAYLTLISTPIAPDSLMRLKHLKYLAYGTGDSNDSLSIARLQQAMPNTLVTAAEPFCMGTGWLIVFLASVLLLTVIALQVRNSIRA